MLARPTRIAFAVAAAAALAALAAATAGAERRKPTLHEDLDTPPDEARRAAEKLDGLILGREPRAGANPIAFAAGARILPRPERAPRADARARGAAAADRATEFRPDRDTHADGTLGYDAVFNPSVTPHKRVSALDAVRSDTTLAIGATTLEPAPVGGDPEPGRDLFWAALELELSPGRELAIPSVAPDMRILSYEVAADVSIEFFKDGADNFYARPASGRGRARLVMLVDADAAYFGADIPAHLRVRDARADLAFELPPGPQKQARKALSSLELDGDRPLGEALGVLVDTFRSFETGELPAGTGDIFWDLFTSRLGVCRHRAFAFAIIANELGIPTRYVQNEAHAFVEVHVPEIGWMRIDLGGAALDLDVSSEPGAQPHQPRQPDPFAGSPSSPDGSASADSSPRSAGSSFEAPAPSPQPSPVDSERGALASEPETSPAAAPSAPSGDGSAARGGGPTSPRGDAPSAPEPSRSARVTSADREGFRGERARVAGRIRSDDDDDLAGRRVQLHLVSARGRGEPIPVGQAVTDERGRFSTSVSIPASIELGDYRVIASVAGVAR